MGTMTFGSVTKAAAAEGTIVEPVVSQKSATQWAQGEVIIGFLIGIGFSRSRYGNMKVYTIAKCDEYGTTTGEQVRVITSSDLEPQLSLVKDRQAVRIECLGKTPGSRRVNFSVQTSDNFLTV